MEFLGFILGVERVEGWFYKMVVKRLVVVIGRIGGGKVDGGKNI